MKTYTIRYTMEAKHDIGDIFRYIDNELSEPETAKKYRNGIVEACEKLRIYGGSLAISQREYIQNRWGPAARTITYKKMVIIFNVINDIILIRRVIAGNLII
jgi:plasmid stabilization system protein ParE